MLSEDRPWKDFTWQAEDCDSYIHTPAAVDVFINNIVTQWPFLGPPILQELFFCIGIINIIINNYNLPPIVRDLA